MLIQRVHIRAEQSIQYYKIVNTNRLDCVLGEGLEGFKSNGLRRNWQGELIIHR